MAHYKVQTGDCIESIAFQHGYDWKKLWDHPNNSALKKERQDPNVLLEGDVVYLPDKKLKKLSRPTGQRHKFTYKGVPSKLEVRLLDEEGLPRKGLKYRIELSNGQLLEGKVDSDGWVRKRLMPDIDAATLTLFSEEDDQEIEDVYELSLGELDPVTETQGALQRLFNLGFEDVDPDGQDSETTQQAIMGFQRSSGLAVTGELDAETRKKIQELYRS